jgi:hypothetical protein
VNTVPHATVNPQPDPAATTPDLIGRLGRELISLSAVWFELDPADRRMAARAVAEAADDLAPALAAMRTSAPNVCVAVDVTVRRDCSHEEARRG